MPRDWTWRRLAERDGNRVEVAPNTPVVNQEGQIVRHQCAKRTKPALQRFLDKVAVVEKEWDESPCWIWQGHINQETGYGQLKDDANRTVNAHAFSYNQYVGDLGEGEELTQGCDQRACCSPRHVYAVARSENKKRCKSKLYE